MRTHKNARTATILTPNKLVPREGSQTEAIYNSIINNPGVSLNHIAKINNCYYSSVQRVAERFFDNTFEIKKRDSKTETA